MEAVLMSSSRERGALIIEFAPETDLNALASANMQADLFRLVEGEAGQAVVIDLSNVAFLSSQALGMLLTLRLKAARGGSRIVLAGVRPALREIISLTQIDQLYPISVDRQSALRDVTGD